VWLLLVLQKTRRRIGQQQRRNTLQEIAPNSVRGNLCCSWVEKRLLAVSSLRSFLCFFRKAWHCLLPVASVAVDHKRRL
jgi:hypothetical protein